MPHESDPESGDLSVTALYTSATWAWARLPYAELFIHRDAKVIFWVTNLALSIARIFVRGAQSLRHSLVHRHVLIDRLVTSSKADTVVELAAGLSRRGAAVSSDPSIRYLEFDLPHMTARKRVLLSRTPEGCAVASRSNYEIHDADVLRDPWEKAVSGGERRVLIAEGLLMYLEPHQRCEFFIRAARCLQDTGGALIFDLFPPAEQPGPSVVGRLLGWLMRRFTGGIGFNEVVVTRETILRDLKHAGFDHAEALEPFLVADEWNLPFKSYRTNQLIFHAKKDR